MITNNLLSHFEALWPKILPLDLKPFVHFFFLTLYSILPNRRVYTFISGQVCLLGSIKVKRQILQEINVYTRLFESIEYLQLYMLINDLFIGDCCWAASTINTKHYLWQQSTWSYTYQNGRWSKSCTCFSYLFIHD